MAGIYPCSWAARKKFVASPVCCQCEPQLLPANEFRETSAKLMAALDWLWRYSPIVFDGQSKKSRCSTILLFAWFSLNWTEFRL